MTVAMRSDDCRGCGKPFQQVRKRGRPRLKCDTCSGLGLSAIASFAASKGDPPVRPDGKCVVCLRSRKITKQARKYAGVQVDLDPFCSSTCCRRWHRCELKGEASDAQVEASRENALAYREARAAAGIVGIA